MANVSLAILFPILLISAVLAHGSAADTGGTTTGDDSMVPWLHFAGGDVLWFKTWTPIAKGQLAGASIGLFFLAIFSRWIAALRGSLEAHWRNVARTNALNLQASAKAAQTSEANSLADSATSPRYKKTLRTFAPFTIWHDVPRGMLFAFEAFVGYALMLAVMTFQAAYVICVVFGFGVGELLFGRYSRHGAHIL